MSPNTSLAVSGIKAKGGCPSTSNFVGVSYEKSRGTWKAYAQLATGKRKNIGRAPTAAEAAALRAEFIATHGVAAPSEVRSRKAATVTSGEAA
ncbi:hypothetical protein PQR34_28945 [Paraburkholderia sediminicola]|uniref:hypothetical protein n=1 Tax=Paraburkholderia sediminicola TaxID=458836 RepID=UPI0038B84BC5